MTSATTYQTAQAAVAANEDVIYQPIYVFPASLAEWETLDYPQAFSVVYADRTAEAVRLSRKAYPVRFKLIGCGVARVACIFIKEAK